MNIKPFSNQLVVVAALAFTAISHAEVSQPQAPNRPQVDPSFGKRPLSFEVNQGQSDSAVKFLSRGPGYSLHLTSAEAVLTLRRSGSPSATQPGKGGSIKPQTSSSAVLRMQLQGANPKAAVIGFDELPGKVNYLHGKEAKAWRTGIATYAKVHYTGVYPGVDLVYYGNQRQLEYDFVVAPGADPKAIRMNFAGAEKLALDDEGKLIVKTAGGDVIQNKPVVYQEINGVRQDIAGNYVLYPAAEGKAPQVGFQLAQYDASRPVTIDPVMVYAIYLGGTDNDTAGTIAVDRWGNIYVTGSTDSTDFPVARAFQNSLIVSSDDYGFPYKDAFVTKLNPKGAVVYSTYFGGTGDEGGSSLSWKSLKEQISLAVDSSGNAYVTGSTTSTDFPTKKPLQATLKGTTNAFVAKLNSSGLLVYSTYLGGSSSDHGFAIAADRSGNAYITGQTSSADFPTAHALQNALIGTSDAFIAKLNPVGSLVYSTYLGGSGTDDSSVDVGAGIAVDNFGSAYITGTTNSTDFPTMRPLQQVYASIADCGWGFCAGDAFVAKLNPAGSALVYSTYLGGDSTDESNAITVDGQGNAYITGNTWSSDFPTANPWQETLLCAYNDTFIAKLNRTGSSLIYSTYLGGGGGYYDYTCNQGTSIAVDRKGSAYVGGMASCDYGLWDGYVTKFNSQGALVYYSALGLGSDCGSYRGLTGKVSIALDNIGNAYVGGTSTYSYDTNPLSALRLLRVGPGGGGGDVFLTKIVGN